ncbi:hypothetical protein [Streptomyces roseochromogenus]|uniref:Uncharacterized protein n=1 Tax=Streptomyces roseochromogenus subsp. oscitans DS 12.976 TaxID=1352936 RepID=V6KWP7_STRRC|nr:hypothetical protein [Streptomyces roseochromogenus]EST36585.1 hypothetical protein M878_01475 [Streptomyces roseochromogenus subsp. oscitans DS 12.976]
MRRLPHPHTGEGTAVLGVLLLTALEMTAVATAPRADRPVGAGALIGAATAAFVVVAAVVHRHRRAQREARRQLTETADESWFTTRAITWLAPSRSATPAFPSASEPASATGQCLFDQVADRHRHAFNARAA